MSSQIRFEIKQRDVFAAGHAFAASGPYERIVGRVHFKVDPQHQSNSAIVDLDKAPRNAQGRVCCSSDIFILKPVDAALGNQRLFFGYGNRGNKRELQFFNDAPANNDPSTLEDAGNGFLMRRGYSIVWAAWEGDLLPGNGRLLLDVPIATQQGEDITGPVRCEFIVNTTGVYSLPLSGHASTRSYPPVSRDTQKAKLSRRRYPGDSAEIIDSGQWCFARLESGMGQDAQGSESAITPSDSNIYLYSGFEPGWIYELVYTGKQPRVYGLGHVVVRDLVSFFKHESSDAAGVVNPLGKIDKAYAWGRSQTGRCLRDFVHGGYNADADGRRVFDGVLSHVAGGGLLWMNQRFAQVVSPAGQQYEYHHNYADRFPFSYARTTDHLTGCTDAILTRPDTDPLVIHTQTATEYWQRRGSLVHTDTRGNDLPQPEGVRIYFWSSSQHFADPNLRVPQFGVRQQLENVVSTSMLFRAMLNAMDNWASRGKAPPPSCIPRRSDETLVDYANWRKQFPIIPGAMMSAGPASLPLLDFGPETKHGIFSTEPPKVVDAKGYAVLVPAVDADGNDIAGVRAPMVQAPLGTYTGWALRSRDVGYGANFEYTGGYIPFADTPSEAAITGDPRPSVLDRYASRDSYRDAIEAAARDLCAQGLMLEEDIQRCVDAAANWGRPRHVVRLP